MGSGKGETYDLAESDLKSFTRSSVRTKLMLILLDGGKTVSELEDIMGIRSSTILHAMKSLMQSNLVERRSRGYCLTNIGRIQAMMLDDLVNTIITINEHYDFWIQHDMSGIPIELQKRIGMLGQGQAIRDTLETPLKSLDYFIEALSDSKVILGVSPVLIRGYPEAISEVVERGAHVELILTTPVLKVIIAEQRETMRDLLKKDNFTLYSIDGDVRASFTVTESFLNLGLSRMNGSYDLGTDLVYTGEKAIEWGMMLYDYYKSQSIRLKDV